MWKIALLLLAGLPHLARAYTVAQQQQAVPSFFMLPSYYPDLSSQLKYSKSIDGFVESLEAPGLNCTVILPTNEAISKTIKALGSSVGLFLQNKTMQEQLFKYFVIPQDRLTAHDLQQQNVTAATTMEGETLWFVKRGDGGLYASFRRDYMIPLQTVDIRVRGCVVHTISDGVLIAPSLLPGFEQWLRDAGSPPMTVRSRDQWAPAPIPAPDTLQDQDSAAPQPAHQAATADDGPSSITPAPSVPAPAPGTSAGSSSAVSRVERLVQLLAAALVTALAIAGSA